jgi:cytochrome P450
MRGEHVSSFDAVPQYADLPHPVGQWQEFIGMAQGREAMFRFSLNGEEALWLNDPELMRATLMAPFSQVGLGPLIRGFEKAGGLGNALTVNFSDSWRGRRRVVQRPLTHKGVRQLGLLIQRSLDEGIGAWEPTSEFDVAEAVTNLILDVIGVTLFSGDHREFREVIHAFDDERNAAFVAISQDASYDPRSRREFADALAALDSFIVGVIADRRQEPRDDLLSHIVAASTSDGESLSDGELRDELVGLIYAGHKTTANTLIFALWLLATHSDIQQALAREAAAIPLDDEFHAVFEERAPLSAEVITETLRLYPVGDLIDRAVVGDFTLAGVDLPVGTPIIFSTWIPHRAQSTYDAPTEFRPGRHRPGVMSPDQRGAYLPFSTGPKVCLGVHLATFEGALALALIARRWSVSSDVETVDVAHDPLLFADPNLRLSLARR